MKLETPKETSIPKLTAFNVSAKKNRILSLDLSVFTSKSVLQIDDAQRSIKGNDYSLHFDKMWKAETKKHNTTERKLSVIRSCSRMTKECGKPKCISICNNELKSDKQFQIENNKVVDCKKYIMNPQCNKSLEEVAINHCDYQNYVRTERLNDRFKLIAQKTKILMKKIRTEQSQLIRNTQRMKTISSSKQDQVKRRLSSRSQQFVEPIFKGPKYPLKLRPLPKNMKRMIKMQKNFENIENEQ